MRYVKQLIATQRLRILVRDDYICQYCGKHATTIDHIISATNPNSTNNEKNLVACCFLCNVILGKVRGLDDFVLKKLYILNYYEKHKLRYLNREKKLRGKDFNYKNHR